MITVVNTSKAQPSVYIGRKWAGREASPLGNPFKGNNAVPDFRELLWNELHNPNSPARAEISRLVELNKTGIDITLGCWCKPKPCHGDVVKAAVEYYSTNRLP